MDISIGILTYFAPVTLEYTLGTYKRSGLLSLSDDVFVIIQKSDRQDFEKSVCEAFGIKYICLPNNTMMAGGFKQIYETAKYDKILFLENDFVNFCSHNETINFIENSIYFIDNGADIVRGRNRRNSGDPNYAKMNLCNISPEEFKNSTLLSECIYWLENPETVYNSITKIAPLKGYDDWYTTTSRYCNYTNNPYVCTKSFFEKAILPNVVDGQILEDAMDKIWQDQNYKCVFGPGLFTHHRMYDGHF